MLQMRLLGAPSLRDASGDLHLPSQKAQALLYFLAAEHERSFARSQVIALLWEASSEREGRNSLSTVLSRLRAALPELPLRTDGDTLAWQPNPIFQVDLHRFQAGLPAPSIVAAWQTTTDIQPLETTISLYRGPFLDGFGLRDSAAYDEWLRLERERWQQRWLNALELLIDAYSQAARWAAAIEYARRALAADPLQERFHRALMRLHSFAGNRAAALAQYRLCREVLDRELGVDPDSETNTLHQLILDGRLERPAQPPAAVQPQGIAAPAATPLAASAASAAAQVAPSRPPQRLAARLELARRRGFVGRRDELATFAAILAEPLPPYAVLYIYGPGGVGKSALLSEFVRLAEEASIPALLLDARNIQPSPDGLLSALRELTGQADPLSSLPERHVLLIDTYELLMPIDGWLRDQLLPQIPEGALVVLAGRNLPAPGWRVDPAWQAMTRVVQLGNLSEAEAADYLARRNIAAPLFPALLRFTRGYPLALSLVVEVLLQRPATTFEAAAPPDVVKLLVERFLDGVPSVAHRAALEACAEVRMLSEPLLAAMLAVDDAHELFDWLRVLSFIATAPRGLFPHDLAREALTTDLRWRNPPWHAELHRRARGYYLSEFERTTDPQYQYLVLLDLIFLHDNPLIRSIFTWSDIGGLVEDTPRASDWPLLIEMVRRHEGDDAARIANSWFARQPEGVTVFRESSGALTGFMQYVTLRPDCGDIIAADPCAATAQRRMQAHSPLAPGQVAVILRSWMERDSYQAVSPTQGMIFVATIRYLLTNPQVAYSFHVIAEPDFWQPAMEHVLVHREPAADFTVGGRRFGVFVHDWRAQPPHAWFETLAAREVTA